jgi:choline-sulfatase
MPRIKPIVYGDLDAHSRRLYDVAAVGDYEVTDADVRSSRHGYYASISYIDSLVGQLLETLASCGLADSTIIALTSDHGDFLGERGLWYKMSFLEYSARVPFVISGERFFEPRRVETPASLADVLPTLCDIATNGKAALARPVDGQSLYPRLHGAAERSSNAVFGEYLAEGALAPIYMLRRDKWKFIRSETDPDQLFDLKNDPDELNNLAKNPELGSLVAGFTALLAGRFDPADTKRRVMESQKARHMLFAALKRGDYFPWDFQPLREASEQYTRNHMDVTERDIQSRFPKAPELPGKSR